MPAGDAGRAKVALRLLSGDLRRCFVLGRLFPKRTYIGRTRGGIAPRGCAGPGRPPLVCPSDAPSLSAPATRAAALMLRFVVATEEPAEERDGTTRGRSYIVPDLEHRLPGRGHYLLPSKQTLKDLTGRLRCVAARRSHRLSARARYRRRSRLMPARPAAPLSSSSAVHRSHISSRFAKQSVLPLPHYETVVVDKLKVRAPAKGAGA